MNLPAKGLQIQLPAADKLKQWEALESGGLKPYLFAYPIDTLIDVMASGDWTYLANGRILVRYLVTSPGAHSLNLIFRDFNFSSGSRMYLYSADKNHLAGAFGQKNIKSWQGLATAPVPADSVIIEINIDASEANFPGLIIERIAHDYKGVFSGRNDFGKSGSCNVDINCPGGADWQTEKRSVVKFVRGGIWLCSGSLINNTANNGNPYLLTANHCIGTATHARQSVFYFKYESPLCSGPDGPQNFTISGSDLLATSSKVDFCLVNLTITPPENYDPYYAGWDRRVVPYWDSVVTIHHPSGDVKKISKSNRRIVTGDFGGGYDFNTHWKIPEWDMGTTEGGSSGSPLFNLDHKIIGDLTGGDASCDYNFNDYYQKFSISWDKYPDSSNQLKYWLDPWNTGQVTLNGYDPYQEGQPVANFTSRPSQAIVGKYFYIKDVSTGSPTTWQWTFEDGDPPVSTQQDPGPVVFTKPGLKVVKLRVMNDLGSDSTKQTIHVIESFDFSADLTRVNLNQPIKFTLMAGSDDLPVDFNIFREDRSSFTASQGYFTPDYPGTYDVKMTVYQPDVETTVWHYHKIQAVNQSVMVKSSQISNFNSKESPENFRLGSNSYIPGSNDMGLDAFAELFSNLDSEPQMITGVELHLLQSPSGPGPVWLPVAIWSKNGQIKARDSVRIDGLEANCRITARFSSPVAFDSILYAGYEVPEILNGTLAASAAVDRGSGSQATAFARKNGSWQSLNDLIGIKSALNLKLEVSPIVNSFDQEICIQTVPVDRQLIIDLGDLLVQSYEMQVFDLAGRQLITSSSVQGSQIKVNILSESDGILILRLLTDEYSFSRKILFMKD